METEMLFVLSPNYDISIFAQAAPQTTIIIERVLVIGAYVVMVFRRIRHGYLAFDDIGAYIPELAGGVTLFGRDTVCQAANAAKQAIERQGNGKGGALCGIC